MIKNQKGITLIALVVTVIITLILLGTATFVGIDIYKDTAETAFVVKMKSLQKKIDNLVVENNTNLGQKISSLENLEKVTEIINNAQEEITDWNLSSQNIRYFSNSDIENILDIENIEFDIVVNFDTREIISLEGVDYDGKTYYTQYNLEQGQKIETFNPQKIQNERQISTSNFSTQNILITRNALQLNAKNINNLENKDGLGCYIEITNIPIANATLKYKISEESVWKTIINYTNKGDSYAFDISKSGNYQIELIDNTNTNNSLEINFYIEVINTPIANEKLNITANDLPIEYDYSNLTDSSKFAYVTIQGTTYLWVPRFAYNAENDIKFVKGITNIATDENYLNSNEWTVPSIFKDNEKDVPGKWISVTGTNNNLIDFID